MGITDEDLENLNSEMLQAFNNGAENIEDLPAGEDSDEDEEDGKTATFPFLNRLFSNGESPRSGESSRNEEPGEGGARTGRDKERKGEKAPKRKFLESYCINLTERANSGKLDTVVGREQEIERVVQILNRRQKNNPCLIGEPGVGKTAIAEGLAQRISNGAVPFKLRDKEVYLLDLTALVAGTQFRGQFESRMINPPFVLSILFQNPFHILRHRRGQRQLRAGDRMRQLQCKGVQRRAGDQRRVLGAVEPISCQRVAQRGHMQPQLMGAAGLRHQSQQRKMGSSFQYLIVGHGAGAVRPDFSGHGGAFVPSDGRVHGTRLRRRTAQADAPVLPMESVRVESLPQQVVDIAAFGGHHQSGGALVQPAHRMKQCVPAPLKSQRTGHGGSVRHKIGGVRGHVVMLQGVALLVLRLRQVGVQPHAVLPGQNRALPQQLAGHGEGGAGSQSHPVHAECGGDAAHQNLALSADVPEFHLESGSQTDADTQHHHEGADGLGGVLEGGVLRIDLDLGEDGGHRLVHPAVEQFLPQGVLQVIADIALAHVVIEQLQSNAPEPEDHLCYLTKTPDGKILKSSTVYVHNSKGKVSAILAINFDISKLLMVESAVSDLISTGELTQSEPEKIVNINDLLDDLIKQSVTLVGKPVALMNKDDKVKAIRFLNQNGAFLVTKSGDKVARYFGISKYTLYSYIDTKQQEGKQQ